MLKKKNENGYVIVIKEDGHIIGCISKMTFKNGKDGIAGIDIKIDDDPNKALKFSMWHTSWVLLTHLCSNANARDLCNGVDREMFIDSYKNYYNNFYNRYKAYPKENKE